jgi:hypothetical protein
MSKSTVHCSVCSCDLLRENGEIKRKIRLGKKHFCPICLKDTNKAEHLRKHSKSKKNISHIKRFAGSCRDEYTEFRWYMKCCKQRGQDVNITLEYLKDLWEFQHRQCPITGWGLRLRTLTDKRTKLPEDASLDRIDSSKGYIKGNVRFISCMANLALNVWSDEDLIEFCHAVAKNNVGN